jgi:hypothetical protein
MRGKVSTIYFFSVGFETPIFAKHIDQIGKRSSIGKQHNEKNARLREADRSHHFVETRFILRKHASSGSQTAANA